MTRSPQNIKVPLLPWLIEDRARRGVSMTV